MFTWKQWIPPTGLSGDALVIVRSLQEYLRSLETPGALKIGEASITADSGVACPATQNASSDANTLDDYEESASNVSTTITPQGGSFTATATYNYTKVGRKVFVEAQAVITNVGTATGVVDINIPFVPARTTAGSAEYIATVTGGLSAYVQDNGGQGQLRFFKPDGTTAIAVSTISVAATFHV